MLDFSGIDKLIADLGSMNYNYKNPYAPEDISKIQAGRDYSWAGVPVGTPASSSSGGLGHIASEVGKGLLDTIGSLGGLVTNQLANWTDGNLNWKDIPLADSLAKSAQDTWKAWHTGGFQYQDIPVLGNLASFSKDTPGFSQTLSNLGWQKDPNQPGLGFRDVASFLGDVALDPVTWLTLGGSSAAKIGALAAKDAAKSAAEKFGVNAGRDAFSVPNQILEHTLQATGANDAVVNPLEALATKSRALGITAPARTEQGINADLLQRLGQTRADTAAESIQNAAAKARLENSRNLANFDIPLTDIAFGLGKGKLPERFANIDPLVGALGGASADHAMQAAGLDGKAAKELLQSRYGVDSADKLSSQALADLHDLLAGAKTQARPIPDFNVQEGKAFHVLQPNLNKTVEYQKFDPQAFLHQIDPKIANLIEPTVMQYADNIAKLNKEAPPVIKSLGDLIPGLTHTTNPLKGLEASGWQGAFHNVADQLANADNVAKIKYDPFTPKDVWDRTITAKELPKLTAQDVVRKAPSFQQDIGNIAGASAKNPFNARTLRSDNAFVNDQANHIQDANAQIHSGLNRMEKDMGRINKSIKDFTPAEKDALIHEVENVFPGAKGPQGAEDYYAANNIPEARRAQIKSAAADVKQVLANLGQRDLNAGTLNKLLPNYFPHVLKQSGETDLQKLLNDPEVSAILGRSQKNRFAKERTSFDSFAQLKNVVAGLKEKSSKLSPDSEEYAKIESKINDFNNLFETDPTIALSKRYYATVRSAPMKELYTKLEKNGMLVHDQSKGADFHTLTKDEAKQLGLQAGDQIHPEVMEGLKKVQDLFTMDGMNKLLRNVTAATNIWKNLVTTFSPKHYFGNFIGNVANTSMAGVGPKAYVKAGRIFQAARAGKLTAKQNKLLQDAADDGVLNQGFISDFTRQNLQFTETPLNRIERVEKKISDWKPTKLTKDLGNGIDNLSRLALYIHALEKTGSRRLASQQVRKYLFNYREMTKADKFIRAGIPFWNWTKNNLPLQLKEIITKPRFVNSLMKARNTAYNAYPDSANAPDWQKQSYVPLFGKMRNLRLPQQDITNLADPLNFILSSLNPVAKIPLEMASNKTYFTGNPIDWHNLKGSASPFSKPGFEYLMKQLGIFGNAYDAANNQTPAGQDLMNFIFGKSFPVSQQQGG